MLPVDAGPGFRSVIQRVDRCEMLVSGAAKTLGECKITKDNRGDIEVAQDGVNQTYLLIVVPYDL